MTVVWKMELQSDLNTYTMKKGAVPLHVDWQRGPQMWFSVDPEQTETEERTFLFIGTGQPFDDSLFTHIGSMKTPDSVFIFHVFEKTP